MKEKVGRIEGFLVDVLAFALLPVDLIAKSFKECEYGGCNNFLIGKAKYCSRCAKIKDKLD